MNNKKHKKGSVALTTVIIISALLIYGGIAVVLGSIDTLIATNDNVNVEISKVYAQTCFQESVYRIKTNPSFEGMVSYTDADGNTCEASINNNLIDPNIKEISITSTYNNHNYLLEKQIDSSTDPFEIVD